MFDTQILKTNISFANVNKDKDITRMQTKVEIINIGDELLIGQVINTNASWMGQMLSRNGFEVVQMTSVSDQSEEIAESVRLAMTRADIVLLSGGLGPTKDDITKKTLADFFNSEMYFNEESYLNVKRLFKARGFDVMEVNKNQAYLPVKAEALPNMNGTAFGMWFQQDEKVVISMPGVPFEMKAMMEQEVLPRLIKRFQPAKYYHKTIMTQGVGESVIASMIEDIEDQLPEHISLAYLPRPGIVRLRLSARGQEMDKLQAEVEKEVKKIEAVLGYKTVFAYDDQAIEEALAGILKDSGITIATAESCTGGNIAHLITSVPGSSAYFSGSIISYSNQAKKELLAVKESDIDEYGAVSEAVVRQMAEGAKKALQTDYAVSTSGIAGPDGGTDDKPVGATWIAVSGPHKTIAVLHQFGEHRGRNITRASLTAINMLRVMILEDLDN